MFRRIHRKERGRSMPNLTDIIEEAQAEARATCTQCLIDYLPRQQASSSAKFADPGDGHGAARQSPETARTAMPRRSPRSCRTALAIAIYTAELSGYRSVQWSGAASPAR